MRSSVLGSPGRAVKGERSERVSSRRYDSFPWAPLKQRQSAVGPDSRFNSLKANALVYESTLNVQGMQVTSPKAWNIIATKLRDANVRVISQQELLFEKEKGAVILDIRPTGEFENGHISGSHNASLFQLITGWDPVKILRRAGFAFFGVFNGTEVNPNFASEVEEVLSSGGFEHGKETPVVLLCYCGGSLDPTVSMKNGKQSRSLIAAYELLKLGFTKVSVLKGGFSEWKRNERPYEVLE